MIKRMQSSTEHQALTSAGPNDKRLMLVHQCQARNVGASVSIVSLNSGDLTIYFLNTQETKEKIGERIVALQHLVSPFGKTDTASVLLEAIEYIKFLQEQVKVLSAPYLHSGPVNMEEQDEYSLRSRGLCLVPITNTVGLAQSNGADIWAPIKSSSPGFF